MQDKSLRTKRSGEFGENLVADIMSKEWGFDVDRIDSVGADLSAYKDGVAYIISVKYRRFTPGESLQEGFDFKDESKLKEAARRRCGATGIVAFIGCFLKDGKQITVCSFINSSHLILLPKRKDNYVFYFDDKNSTFEKLIQDGVIYRVVEKRDLGNSVNGVDF